MDLVLFFLISLVAALFGSVSGGGSSAIAIPLFLSLGISFPLAVAAQKVNAAFWLAPAAFNYLRDKKIDWKFIFLVALLGLIGAYVGVVVVVSFNQRVLEVIVGIFILILVTYIYLKKEAGLKEVKVSSGFRRGLMYPFAVILGFYESVFGAANGIIFASASFYSRGFDLIKALGHYFVTALVWVLFAAALLAKEGHYDLPLFGVVILGSLLGGYFGSKYAKLKGNRFIKIIFVIIGGLLGLKLLFGV